MIKYLGALCVSILFIFVPELLFKCLLALVLVFLFGGSFGHVLQGETVPSLDNEPRSRRKQVVRSLLHFLPVVLYLIAFSYGPKILPEEKRPPISVNLLPAWDNIIVGEPVNSYYNSTADAKDLLAWVSYGVLHFASPLLFLLAVIWFKAVRSPTAKYKRSSVDVETGSFSTCAHWPEWLRTCELFALAYGTMNIAAVFTQILFPNAPPWYLTDNDASKPASYSTAGSAGGLMRVDTLFSSHFYQTTFSNSPLVFGAFPSMHSGWAVLIALFIIRVKPKSWIMVPMMGYVWWIWWSTMYLGHHFFVDLLAGAVYAICAFKMVEPQL